MLVIGLLGPALVFGKPAGVVPFGPGDLVAPVIVFQLGHGLQLVVPVRHRPDPVAVDVVGEDGAVPVVDLLVAPKCVVVGHGILRQLGDGPGGAVIGGGAAGEQQDAKQKGKELSHGVTSFAGTWIWVYSYMQSLVIRSALSVKYW